MDKERVRGSCRLVLVIYPFQGHINPMLQLATILHSKGFPITIVHPKLNAPNPSTYPDFTFIPISDGLSDKKLILEDFLSSLVALNSNCYAPFRLCMERLIEEAKPHERIACIIYDTLMHVSQTVANDLKLPGIGVRTSAAATMLAFAVYPRPDGQGYTFFQESKIQDLDPDLHNIKDHLISLTRNSTDTMLELRAAVTAAMKASSAIIVNTMDFLEQAALKKVQEYFPCPILPTGPFHKYAPISSTSLFREDTNCITWLDKQAPNSVIYVSLGSLAMVDEKELAETAWGLANSEQPFLWVVRPGSVRGSEWIELLPKSFEETVGERGCIVKWAPQKEVLAHRAVGGFWTHCGWNSTLESVCAGVPMLCRPFFGDQPLNVSYVTRVWKIGVQLENELQREEIEQAIRRLMVGTEGEEFRQRAVDLKEKVEFCLREAGSSYNCLNQLIALINSF